MARGAAEFHRARAAARQLLHDAGVTAPEHIDVELFAHALGAEVVRGGLTGASGRVIRIGKAARIRISDRIVHPGVVRFTLAHELGHLALRHEIPPGGLTMDPAAFIARVSARTRRNGVDQEDEADVFAAEVLMPEFLTRRRCEVSPVSLEPVRAIARDFGTSLSASAIRFAELTSERCAAVYSERGRVKWAVPSSTFTATIARDAPLDRASIAHDFFTTGTVDDCAQPVPADAWIDARDADVEIVEHSAALPDLGAVITMLWVPESAATCLGMYD